MSWFKNTWFRDPNEEVLFINDTAVRIRAGMMLAIPLFMALTLFDVAYTSPWIVDHATVEDTYETNAASQIIYSAEITKRTYDYSVQTALLFYGLFELLAGMFVWSSRLSPTIHLSNYLTRHKRAEWKPLTPKRFAWGLGISLVSLCLVFFNPDVFANWVNAVFSASILPTTYNYIPYWLPVNLVWVCIALMWFEAVLGFCLGCKIHSGLVWLGVIKEPCYACHNIDWDAIQRKHEAT